MLSTSEMDLFLDLKLTVVLAESGRLDGHHEYHVKVGLKLSSKMKLQHPWQTLSSY